MLKKMLSWAVVLIYLIVMYNLSAEPAKVSSKRSQQITRQVQTAIGKSPVKGKISWNDHSTRKLAHGVEYFILFLLLHNAIIRSGFNPGRSIIYSIILSLVYAAFDEIHQAFVEGRGPGIQDVFIDAVGVGLGAITKLYAKIFYKGGHREQ